MKKLILCIWFTMHLATHAETLFIKSNGQPLTENEHDIVYDIMLENQFPMSLHYGQFAENEVAVMNRKIALELPQSGISAQFIPTTLYELFALRALQDQCAYRNSNARMRHFTGNLLGTRVASCTVEQTSFLLIDSLLDQSILTQPLMLEQLKQFHKNVNDFIVAQLAIHNLNPSSLTNALEALDLFDFWNINITQAMNKYKIRKKIVQQAIRIEYKAHRDRTFPLYRGAEYADFDPPRTAPSLHLNRSISFGMSLFAGCLFDNADDGGEFGACAYTYICCVSEFGYALPISMHEYAHGALGNMFYIPPIPTLLGLISRGESFHPRTKIVDASKEIIGFDETNTGIMQSLQINTGTLPARNVYSHMLYYIKEHHIVIKK